MNGIALSDRVQSEKEKGYTLIEVLVTIVIMGTIILVVNVVMISIIRVSYTTDARIKVRQNVEFATEVFRRAARNAEQITYISYAANPAYPDDDPCGPGEDGTELQYPVGIQMILGGGADRVIFYVDKEENLNPALNCKSTLKARWEVDGDEWDVTLTSPSEAVLNDNPSSTCNFWPENGFTVLLQENEDTGTTDIILNITADSAMEKSLGEPVVDCVIKQVSVLKRPSEL